MQARCYCHSERAAHCTTHCTASPACVYYLLCRRDYGTSLTSCLEITTIRFTQRKRLNCRRRPRRSAGDGTYRGSSPECNLLTSTPMGLSRWPCLESTDR